MLKQRILEDLKKTVGDLGYKTDDIVLSIPKNSNFGEYTTNIPLQLAKQNVTKGKQSPVTIANKIADKLWGFAEAKEYLEKIEVAGAGFINFYIKPEALMESLHKVCDYSSLVNPQIELDPSTSSEQKREKILIEFAQMNTHKPFHIGHSRNIILGESISRILEAVGDEVFRVNYQGDIGLHIAKAIWGIEKIPDFMDRLKDEKDPKKRQDALGEAYVKGALAYESDETAKSEIGKINRMLYAHNPKLEKLWQKTRAWSLEYFEELYKILGVKFKKLFFESEIEERGEMLVRDNIDKVFVRDQGAIIFKGEDHGLHNRVFITSEGNPTYEAKEMGIAEAETKAFDSDRQLIVVANEQDGYFQVTLKAIEQVLPEIQGRRHHVSYGVVGLKSGKMSSRTGDVVKFDWLLDEVRQRVGKVMKKSAEIDDKEKSQIIDIVSIGAIKFGMLKFAPNTNIAFDLENSVALDGDSGPYLQYTFARAKSVLRNAQYDYIKTDSPKTLELEERLILQKIEHFETFIQDAASELHPNILASFLLDFARLFNLFYSKHQIIKGEKSEFRLTLTCAVAVVLKQGLHLLGIEAPERM